VVKLHDFAAAKWLPATSVTAVEIVAVNSVFGARLLVGVNVAVLPEYVTVPGTGVVPFITTNDVAFSVAPFMGSLNVAVMDGFLATLVAAFAGPVERTDGATFGPPGVVVLQAAASSAADASSVVKRVIRCMCVIYGVSGKGSAVVEGGSAG
jgi:hypothetical protein